MLILMPFWFSGVFANAITLTPTLYILAWNTLTWKWIDLSAPWTYVHYFCHLTDATPLFSQCTTRHQMKAMNIIFLLVPCDLKLTQWFKSYSQSK